MITTFVAKPYRLREKCPRNAQLSIVIAFGGSCPALMPIILAPEDQPRSHRVGGRGRPSREKVTFLDFDRCPFKLGPGARPRAEPGCSQQLHVR